MKRAGRIAASPEQSPLLDALDLSTIRQMVTACTGSHSSPGRMIEHTAMGDMRSIYTGGGLDYEESRAYQAGDDIRFMNWRLHARTGKPFVKVFREERRPDLMILMDRRSNMRFGTRVRLKVGQAAVCSCLLLFHAHDRMLASGMLLLERRLHWESARFHATALDYLLSLLNSPCPPLGPTHEPDMVDALRQCDARMIPGTHWVIISDFHDLDEHATTLLGKLARQYTIRLIRITDPAERQLPDAGRILLGDCMGSDLEEVDLSDHDLRRAFEKAMKKKQDQQRQQLARAGIPLLDLDTLTSIEELTGTVLDFVQLP